MKFKIRDQFQCMHACTKPIKVTISNFGEADLLSLFRFMQECYQAFESIAPAPACGCAGRTVGVGG